MITSEQQAYIEEHAYVPEHLIHYVSSMKEVEPFLSGNFLFFVGKGQVLFVGYPLGESYSEKKLKEALKKAIRLHKPNETMLIAPTLSFRIHGFDKVSSDHYYQLDLPTLSIPQKLRNMVKRAGREIEVKKTRSYDQDHHELVDDFSNSHPVGKETQTIFEKIERYVLSSDSVWIYEARTKKGDLVAFDIAEFKPKHYVFYMFNFNSRIHYIPGGSDLLLFHIILNAKSENKRYMNLGLGINPGITFFKRKWGGVPFLSHVFYMKGISKNESQEALFQKL
jgi:hypothetical protein